MFKSSQVGVCPSLTRAPGLVAGTKKHRALMRNVVAQRCHCVRAHLATLSRTRQSRKKDVKKRDPKLRIRTNPTEFCPPAPLHFEGSSSIACGKQPHQINIAEKQQARLCQNHLLLRFLFLVHPLHCSPPSKPYFATFINLSTMATSDCHLSKALSCCCLSLPCKLSTPICTSTSVWASCAAVVSITDTATLACTLAHQELKIMIQ